MNLNHCFLPRFAGLGVKPHAGNKPRPSVKQARNTAWRLTEQDLVLHHPLDDFTNQVRGTIEQATCAAFISSGEPLQEQLRTGDRKNNARRLFHLAPRRRRENRPPPPIREDLRGALRQHKGVVVRCIRTCEGQQKTIARFFDAVLAQQS